MPDSAAGSGVQATIDGAPAWHCQLRIGMLTGLVFAAGEAASPKHHRVLHNKWVGRCQTRRQVRVMSAAILRFPNAVARKLDTELAPSTPSAPSIIDPDIKR
jgi:hypothetical protein